MRYLHGAVAPGVAKGTRSVSESMTKSSAEVEPRSDSTISFLMSSLARNACVSVDTALNYCNQVAFQMLATEHTILTSVLPFGRAHVAEYADEAY
jgi:hypothetical protein